MAIMGAMSSANKEAEEGDGSGVPLSISQCMSRSVQMQSEIVYSAIWLRNVEQAKYAYLYN